MRSWPVLMAVMLLFVPPQQVLADDGQTGARANDLGVYHTFDEMVSELQNLTAAHPDILRMESIGKTYEGRDLWAVKLSDNVTADEAEPNITIMGGIHAGEIIGVEVALYILNSLVENYTTNSTIGWYVNSTQIWFVPMLNPDGHIYYEQGNQWRKNRRPNPGGTYGVDLNRNFGHLWGLEASHNPPDDDYCGPFAFSENESQAVSKLVTDHHPVITLSYHSYGQYILYPWGNSINQEPVDPRLSQIAWNMSQAMPGGRQYMPMYAREMYSATGDTDDYFYMNLSILPFTIELTTSNRPLDTAVPGICADNYGPVLYVLNYTVGAPPAPPPKRSLSIEGPEKFNATFFTERYLDFTLNNTGEMPEDVSISILSNNTAWKEPGSMSLSVNRVNLQPGKSTIVKVKIRVPEYFPPDTPVGFYLNATADRGANCSKHFILNVDVFRQIFTDFRTDEPLFYVNPGAVFKGNLTVYNFGNVAESLNVSLNLSDGRYEGRLPDQFHLRPGENGTVPVAIHINQQLPARRTILLTILTRSPDGFFVNEHNMTWTIDNVVDVRLMPETSNVTLKERETVTVHIGIENRGNTWQNGTLGLSNDTASCLLDRTQISIPPYTNATANLTISGKRGSRFLTLTFYSNWSRLEEKVDYTIKANETGTTAPYDWTPLLLFVLILVVLAVGLVLWWRFVEVPARPRRKDGQ